MWICVLSNTADLKTVAVTGRKKNEQVQLNFFLRVSALRPQTGSVVASWLHNKAQLDECG